MKKQGARKRQRPRLVRLHPALMGGMTKANREANAAIIARPMREMFRGLLSGEVEVDEDGRAVMWLPIIGGRPGETQRVEIAPNMRGWITCWEHIDKRVTCYHMGVLADRLEEDKEITERLVEQAFEEFEKTVAVLPRYSLEKIQAAVSTAKIAFQFEKIEAAA